MVNSNVHAGQQQQQQGSRYTNKPTNNLNKLWMDSTNSCGSEMNSKTVESLIQPIINQLNFLSVSSSSSSFSSTSNSNKPFENGELIPTNGRKGRSKRAHTLVESLVEAIENFLRQGSELAHEFPEMKDDIMKVRLKYIFF